MPQIVRIVPTTESVEKVKSLGGTTLIFNNGGMPQATMLTLDAATEFISWLDANGYEHNCKDCMYEMSLEPGFYCVRWKQKETSK